MQAFAPPAFAPYHRCGAPAELPPPPLPPPASGTAAAALGFALGSYHCPPEARLSNASPLSSATGDPLLESFDFLGDADAGRIAALPGYLARLAGPAGAGSGGGALG